MEFGPQLNSVVKTKKGVKREIKTLSYHKVSNEQCGLWKTLHHLQKHKAEKLSKIRTRVCVYIYVCCIYIYIYIYIY